jgi:hypothetical protein
MARAGETVQAGDEQRERGQTRGGDCHGKVHKLLSAFGLKLAGVKLTAADHSDDLGQELVL